MTRYDIEQIKTYASSRWPEIHAVLCNVDSSLADGSHHPCPKCGGKDRFRFFDDGTGGAICNQCFPNKNGDGISVVEWMLGVKFADAVKLVADYLGIDPSSNGNGKRKSKDPAEDLEFREWNETLVALWCQTKPPITPEAVRRIGGRIATYWKQYTVIAIPVYGVGLAASTPVGWVLYNISGGTLPKGKPGNQEQVKTKLTSGSKRGFILSGEWKSADDLSDVALIWKTEGPSDLLALLSAPDLPGNVQAIANANGAQEKPHRQLFEFLAGKNVAVIHDADKPGQDGATEVYGNDGRRRPGWTPELATVAKSCKNVVLPFPLAETHGNDLRDYLADGRKYSDLVALYETTKDTPTEEAEAERHPGEAHDDPHYLARVNLHQYENNHGGKLAFWRQEWWKWKHDRYRKIEIDELRAKLTKAIKSEFNRHAVAQKAIAGDEVKSQKVTRSLVGNVIGAMEGECNLSGSIEQGTWLESREGRGYVALQNGILDLDAVMRNADVEECLLPHSPEWFSPICLPYQFDVQAKCPKWDAFLNRNLEGDNDRIRLLQEWAGYLLLPDTSMQKFLILEGEGANGKSVYLAAIEAMLGKENVSHVPLEVFGQRFSLTPTLGKLANIAAECGEIDKVCEGFLKSFTAGDTMHFDRKGKSGVEAIPTARLMLATNNRPRFSDRSGGLWRRMLLIPFEVEIPEKERVPGMDKPQWWRDQGELSGILNWAILGLHKLREQGHFSISESTKAAINEYQEETNPARKFLIDNCEHVDGHTIQIQELYGFYKRWCAENGYRPLGSATFGKEVRRVFRLTKRVRGNVGERKWYYENLKCNCESFL